MATYYQTRTGLDANNAMVNKWAKDLYSPWNPRPNYRRNGGMEGVLGMFGRGQRTTASAPVSPLDAYKKAYAAARRREVRREQQITAGYQDRYKRGMQTVAKLGEQERRDLVTQYGEAGKTAAANVQAQGLGNTTVGTQVQQGIEREQGSARNRLNDSLRREQLGTDAQLSGDLLAWQERPNTIYPDLDRMTQLAAAAGQSQAYGSGGGGGATYGAAPIFAGSMGMGMGMGGGAAYPQQPGGGGNLANPNMGSTPAPAAGDKMVDDSGNGKVYQAANGKYYAVSPMWNNGQPYPVYKNPRTGQWEMYRA